MLNLLFCGNISLQLLCGVAPFVYLCPWLKMVVVSTLMSDSFARHACSGFFMPLRGSHTLFFFIKDIDNIMTAAFP